MMLKGKNIGFFLKRVRKHVQEKLKDLNVSYQFTHDRIFIDYEEINENELIKRIGLIPGLFSYSIIYVTHSSLEDIIQLGTYVLDQEATKEMMSLKIETIRSDKSFPMTSLEITKKIASPILAQAKRKYKVDVHHPEEILYIDIRRDFSYVYMKSYHGLNGFPYGTQGKGLLMMSGGLDSPVAGFLSMKQGIDLELIHFESSPLTPLESVQKVIDLSKELAKYTMTGSIKLHIVPFSDLHQSILANVFDPYIITVMRRMMYRIAEKFAKKTKNLCLINGESLGQVASQTLPSLSVVESVTKIPILRPLITYDKIDVIHIAKQIETYDISIRPFNDCCSIYVPKSPVTKPMEIYAKKYEQMIPNYEEEIDKILQNIITIDLFEHQVLDITPYGFTATEAIKNALNERDESMC